jgi:hypothetical protein
MHKLRLQNFSTTVAIIMRQIGRIIAKNYKLPLNAFKFVRIRKGNNDGDDDDDDDDDDNNNNKAVKMKYSLCTT